MKLNWKQKLDAARDESLAIARARKKATRLDIYPTRNVVCSPGHPETRGGQYSNLNTGMPSGRYRGLWD